MKYESPLNIYVIWHPEYKEGKQYADLIYKTFNRDTEFALKRNLNIPVYYRYEPFRGDKVPIPIDFSLAERNAVVVLIDDEMFLSDGWEAYVIDILDKISDNPNNRLYPVALSKNATSFSQDNLSRLQFIKANSVSSTDETKEFNKLWRFIRSRLLHDFARLLCDVPSVGDTLEKGFNAVPNPPIKLFISHAKADGLNLAQEFRNYIHSETQLDTFFDANDIADSYRFDTQILDQFNYNTALIAILSDEYATREWCRLEISTAKRKKCPVVVVNHLEKGEIRIFPYLGNVPSVKWNSDYQEVIDLTLVQVLCSRFNDKLLKKHIRLYGFEAKYQCMIFSNPPELFNYVDILKKDEKDPKKGFVIYPDPPLGKEEQRIIQEFLPEIIFTTPLHSYQHLEP